MYDFVEIFRGGLYWGYCFYECFVVFNGIIRLKLGRGKGVCKIIFRLDVLILGEI